MKLAEDLWLRGKAAQTSMMNLIAYNTAFAGTATIQAWKLGLSVPTGFWAAMGRAGGVANRTAEVSPISTLTNGPAVVVSEAAPIASDAQSAPEAAGPSPHLLDAPRGGKPDDLTELKGVGAKLAAALGEFGIFHFDQLATLDAEGIAWLDEQQPGFRMICARHGIVEQAAARLS